MPATSSKVTRPTFSVSSLARDFPKPIAPRPPDCIWRMKKIQRPSTTRKGSQEMIEEMKMLVGSCSGPASMRTFLSRRRSTRAGSEGA